MPKYFTIESWASRLGYIVDPHAEGYVWHRENEPASPPAKTAREVMDAILEHLRSEYGGEE